MTCSSSRDSTCTELTHAGGASGSDLTLELEHYFSKSFGGEVEVGHNGVSKIQRLITMASSMLLKSMLASIFATGPELPDPSSGLKLPRKWFILTDNGLENKSQIEYNPVNLRHRYKRVPSKRQVMQPNFESLLRSLEDTKADQRHRKIVPRLYFQISTNPQ